MRVSKKILLRVLTTSLFVSTMVGTTTSARADGGNFRQHANDRVAAIIAALPPSCSHATHTVVDRKPDGSPVIGVDGTVGENTFLDVECPTGVPVAKLAHTNPPTIPTNPVYRASTTSPLRAGITSCANHGGAVMNLRVTSRSKSTPKARLREVGSFQGGVGLYCSAGLSAEAIAYAPPHGNGTFRWNYTDLFPASYDDNVSCTYPQGCSEVISYDVPQRSTITVNSVDLYWQGTVGGVTLPIGTNLDLFCCGCW